MTTVFSRVINWIYEMVKQRSTGNRTLVAQTTATGFPLSPQDIQRLKKHLPSDLRHRLQATIAQLRAEAGLVELVVWVRPEDIAKVQVFARDTWMMDDTIRRWFQDVQSNGRPHHELIAEAVSFKNRLNEATRDAFTNKHSIDGAFILRLIDSWATRADLGPDPVQDERSAQDERAALRTALRTVHMEKAGTATEPPKKVPLPSSKTRTKRKAPPIE